MYVLYVFCVLSISVYALLYVYARDWYTMDMNPNLMFSSTSKYYRNRIMCATTYLKYMRAESSRAESGRAESGRAESGQAAERAQSCRAAARAPVPLRVSDSKEYREHQIQFRKMHACEMRQRSKLAVENTYYSVSET